MAISEKISLDDLDKRILEALQGDASLSNLDLAAKVHATAPTCLRRVKRLTDAGVIERRVALLDPHKLGPSLTAIVEVSLDHQGAEKQEAFEALVAHEPTILQCYRVYSGAGLRIDCAGGRHAAYHALAHRVFAGHANVRNVRSFFSTHRSKFETRVAI